MKLTPQAQIVVDHLTNNPHLTSLQAEGVYRIRRLAARISELKKAGYDIEKSMKVDATGQRYTRYSFTGPQKRAHRPLLATSKLPARSAATPVDHHYA